MSSSSDIVLYHYPFSPYARRIAWYLALTNTPYSQCLQPPFLPRPDLSLVGVNYRRIPVLAIGNDIYCDTRAILPALEPLASKPLPSLSSTNDTTLATLRALLSSYTVNVVFARASQLIPPESPVLKDERFVRDREALSGRSWSQAELVRNRPEALVHIRDAFEVLEGLFKDGREWVEGRGATGPGMADIEAVWPFHWLITMPGALPAPVISAQQYPHVFAYVARFDKAVKEAKAKAPKVVTVKGDEAAKTILGSSRRARTAVDAHDPLDLKEGDMVQVSPIDSGFSHKDTGKLVGLDRRELVVESEAPGGAQVRLHFPRVNFRAKKVDKARL